MIYAQEEDKMHKRPTLAAAIIVNLLRLSEVFVLFRLLPYDWSFLKPIVAGLAAFGTAWGVRLTLASETSLIYTVFNALILVVVFAGVILLLGLSRTTA